MHGSRITYKLKTFQSRVREEEPENSPYDNFASNVSVGTWDEGRRWKQRGKGALIYRKNNQTASAK